ncbi:MAG: UDP-glucose/GDP-mannose dehydrogenase family protein [Candidatus Omnitrophica bacterium]|nr:UDP-glucose/GDP-mannose dehydrogenase family protein [Candidatus Omnitrophota bacterium]
MRAIAKSREITFLLLLSFSLQSFHGSYPALAQVRDQFQIQLPSELGRVLEIQLPDPDKKSIAPFIFHIQDAHSEPDAQFKIKEIIKFIEASRPETLLVAIEGSVGELHPEYLNLIPGNASINEAIVNNLLHKGELTGAELAAWEFYKEGKADREKGVREREIRFVGIENAELYRKNIRTYRSLLLSQDEIKKALRPLRDQLELGASRILNPELRRFIKKRERTKLGRRGEIPASPNLEVYLSYLKTEILNRLGIDLGDRIERLRFPNLVLMFLGEKDPFSEIKIDALFAEIDQLESALLDKLTVKEEERRWGKDWKNFHFLEKLLKLELTPQEYATASRKGIRIEKLNPFVKAALRFYSDARARDLVLYENALREAQWMKASSVLLITGGFHAAGLHAIMKSRGTGYASIQPNFLPLEESLYQRVLRGENEAVSVYTKETLNRQQAIFLKALLESKINPLEKSEALLRHPVLNSISGLSPPLNAIPAELITMDTKNFDFIWRSTGLRSEVRKWPEHQPAKIAVIGIGFVGTAKAIADAMLRGHDVVGYDIDTSKIAALQQGKLVHYMPGMEGLLQQGLQTGRLRFTSDLAEALRGREIVFLALPTPQSKTGEADITYLKKAVEAIAQTVALDQDLIIVNKSTSPPEVESELTKIIDEIIQERKSTESNRSGLREGSSQKRLWIAREPEFFREGKELEDALGESGRIVIGAEDLAIAEKIAALYNPANRNPAFVYKDMPIILMGTRSAAEVKYGANGFRGTKISFISFISWLAEALGLDIEEIADAIGVDPRIIRAFLSCGIGYGGSCFPKDIAAYTRQSHEEGIPYDLLLDVQAINELQWKNFVQKIVNQLGGVERKKIVILGGSFKPETSDVREARSSYIVQDLLKRGAHVSVHDPVATRELAEGPLKEDRGVTYYEHDSDLYGEMMEGADAVVLVTEWGLYKKIDFQKLAGLFRRQDQPLPHLFDGRNIWNPNELKNLGYKYEGIGRSKIPAKIDKEVFIEKVRQLFLAIRLAFINHLAEVSDKKRANIRDVLKGLGHDPVVGSLYLQPGLGFGGYELHHTLEYFTELVRHYLPQSYMESYREIRKDILTEFGLPISPEEMNQIPFITAIQQINGRQIDLYIDKVKEAVGGTLRGKKVAVLGLAYKPGSYSIENSPSIGIVQKLIQEGAMIRATDPEYQAIVNFERSVGVRKPAFRRYIKAEQAVHGTDVQILVTDWPEYKEIGKILLSKKGRPRSRYLRLVDGRHFYDPDEVAALGINYYAVGIPTHKAHKPEARSEIRENRTLITTAEFRETRFKYHLLSAVRAFREAIASSA